MSFVLGFIAAPVIIFLVVWVVSLITELRKKKVAP